MSTWHMVKYGIMIAYAVWTYTENAPWEVKMVQEYTSPVGGGGGGLMLKIDDFWPVLIQHFLY